MRFVDVHGGVLQIRWSWLPMWLAVNPRAVKVGTMLRDVSLLNAATTSEEDLDMLHEWVIRRFCIEFPPFEGMHAFLDSLREVRPTLESP